MLDADVILVLGEGINGTNAPRLFPDFCNRDMDQVLLVILPTICGVFRTTGIQVIPAATHYETLEERDIDPARFPPGCRGISDWFILPINSWILDRPNLGPKQMRMVFYAISAAVGIGFAASVWGEDLIRIYDLAVRSDPILKEAEQILYSRREVKPQARALLLPNFDFIAETQYQRDDISGPSRFGTSMSRRNDTYGSQGVTAAGITWIPVVRNTPHMVGRITNNT